MESELSIYQDVVLLQVVHDIGVQDVLHYFWTDGGEWNRSVIGCCTFVSLLKKGDNMSHCPVSLHSSTVETWLGWSNFCRQLLQKPSRDHIWSSGLVWFEVSQQFFNTIWCYGDTFHAGIWTGAFISGLEIHACKLAKCELKFIFASWKYRHSKKIASSRFHLISNPDHGLKDVSASLQ